jgi:hypothetical protein
MNVTREEAKVISDEIMAAVHAVLAKHQLQALPTKTGYGDNYVLKVEAVKVELGRNGVNIHSKEAMLLDLVGAFKGLNAADLGAKFKHGGRTWVLTGACNSAKTPLVCRGDDGKTYRLPESDAVVAAIKGAR